jgi:6-phosphogluconolactonase
MSNITLSRFYKQCMSVTRRKGCVKIFIRVIGFVCLAAPLRAQFVYEANELSKNVSAYSIGPNGALTPVPGSPFAAAGFPGSMAVDPTGKLAYVASDDNVSAYSIGANRALTPVPGSPFAAGRNGPLSVAVDPTGKFAYVASDLSNNVLAYSIAPTGL